MLDHLENEKILIGRNKISLLLGMCRFPVPLCSIVEVSKVGEISLVAKLRSHTPPEPRSISQNQEGRDWGSCVARWCGELPQRVCAATAKRKRATRTHIYEGLSGLMTSDVRERSDEIPPFILPFRAHAGGNGRLLQR